MLGFSSSQSSLEMIEHLDELKTKHPQELHPHLNCAYDWIKSRDFLSALEEETSESWEWLKTSMQNPPLKVIDKLQSTAKPSGAIESAIIPLGKTAPPCCRICSLKIANTIVDTAEFTVLICKCKKMWCHKACAESYPSKCELCKHYIIPSHHHSSIRSSFAK